MSLIDRVIGWNGPSLEYVTCPICKDLFANPRSLGCDHTFCFGCIQQLMGTQQSATCPECRDPFVKSDIKKICYNNCLLNIFAHVISSLLDRQDYYFVRDIPQYKPKGNNL